MDGGNGRFHFIIHICYSYREKVWLDLFNPKLVGWGVSHEPL